MYMYRNGNLSNETLWDCSIFYSWILLERHYKGICDCSYCTAASSKKRKFDYWIPESKTPNAWRTLVFDRGNYWLYLRSTGMSWKCIFDFYRWSTGWRLQILDLYGKNSLRGLLTVEKMGLQLKPRIKSLFWYLFKEKENNGDNQCQI